MSATTPKTKRALTLQNLESIAGGDGFFTQGPVLYPAGPIAEAANRLYGYNQGIQGPGPQLYSGDPYPNAPSFNPAQDANDIYNYETGLPGAQLQPRYQQQSFNNEGDTGWTNASYEGNDYLPDTYNV